MATGCRRRPRSSRPPRRPVRDVLNNVANNPASDIGHGQHGVERADPVAGGTEPSPHHGGGARACRAGLPDQRSPRCDGWCRADVPAHGAPSGRREPAGVRRPGSSLRVGRDVRRGLRRNRGDAGRGGDRPRSRGDRLRGTGFATGGRTHRRDAASGSTGGSHRRSRPCRFSTWRGSVSASIRSVRGSDWWMPNNSRGRSRVERGPFLIAQCWSRVAAL